MPHEVARPGKASAAATLSNLPQTTGQVVPTDKFLLVGMDRLVRFLVMISSKTPPAHCTRERTLICVRFEVALHGVGPGELLWAPGALVLSWMIPGHLQQGFARIWGLLKKKS